MDTKLIRYYKKQIYGGRSMIARLFDFIVLRLITLFIIFLTVLYFSRSFTVALLISVFITLAVSFTLALVRRKRIRRYIEKDLLRIKQKCLLEELTMLDADCYSDYIVRLFDGFSDITPNEDGFTANKEDVVYYVLHNHPGSVCGIDKAVNIRRKIKNENVVIVSLSDYSETVRTFCVGHGIKLISGKDILKAAADKDMLPNEDTTQQKARNEMSETIVTVEKLKSTAFSKSKVKAYIFCGLIVMCWPLVTGFRVYYPIIAVICFVMAAVTFRKNKSHEESHGVGIT